MTRGIKELGLQIKLSFYSGDLKLGDFPQLFGWVEYNYKNHKGGKREEKIIFQSNKI